MEGLRLEDVNRALDTRDPSLVDMVVSLAGQYDPHDSDLPEGTYTIHELRSELKSWGFRYKTEQEQYDVRVEGWRRLEEEDNAAPLPDRYHLHEVIEALHDADGAFARETLLEVIRRVPIKWGAWRGLKQLFKQTETSGDLELYGALLARIDAELSNTWGDYGEVTRSTLNYLARRGWRFLRQRGESFPAAYVDSAVAVLREYPENTNWTRTWVANHIFFHDFEVYGGPCYGQASFKMWRAPDSLTEHRAFAELWQQDARPMFGLLERARCERARAFAIEGLKADFKTQLRDLDTGNVLRLIQVNSGTVHEFAVWLLENAPRFEQAAFRELGLHDAVLSLLDSPGAVARKYAAKYARTHARDLPLEDLLRLANHFDDQIRKLSFELLKDLDPRKEVGLDGWGSLLGTEYAHDVAVKALHDHFGASELTLDWFRARFLSEEWQVVDFAVNHFGEVHKVEKVDPGYYVGLIDADEPSDDTLTFAIDALSRFDLAALDIEVFKRLLLHPFVTDSVRSWIDEDRLDPVAMGADYWRALAFRPTWDRGSWVAALLDGGPPWTDNYAWNDAWTADDARRTLADVRNFQPGDVGFEWLMDVVRHADEAARDWATHYMFEAFAPAEFADTVADDGAGGEADLGQKTFLFTGKLATMTRAEAQKKVDGANGKKAGGVTKSLDYLVIGDEGSPLYGQGSKGSKQKKAESLNDDGAAIAIISETAFLQMLAGGRREFGEADTVAGCENLWALGVGDDVAEDEPTAVFARQYLRRHHDVIGPKLTDKSVEEARRLPAAFLTFERFRPLFTDKRGAVRKFALEIARCEMARWRPGLDVIVELCETRRTDVRQLFSDALLADDTKENARLRIPPEAIDIDGVYRLCESLDRPTRAIGMALIDKYPQFAQPEALFRLTDSPDRRVRAFVIKTIWGLYRDHGIAESWEPRELDAKYTSTPDARYERGPGAHTRPDRMPATAESLRDFLRRILFGIPPARLPKGEERSDDEPRPLPARRAKLYLLEVMRDLALEDRAFADIVTPLLREFVRTLGKSERGACLVALARLEARWESEAG